MEIIEICFELAISQIVSSFVAQFWPTGFPTTLKFCMKIPYPGTNNGCGFVRLYFPFNDDGK